MPFQKGKSGNPKGSPGANKKQKQIAEQLMHLVPGANKRLEAMLDDPEHVEFAIKTIYERVFGKPPQDVNLANKDGLPFQVIFSTPEKKRGE